MQSSMVYFCDECGAANAEDATICVACQQPLSMLKEAVAVSTPVVVAPVKVSSAAPLEVTAGSPISTGPLAPGVLLIGRYRILKEIGQGGFGSVYQARDLQERGRVVAVKQIDLTRLKPQEIIEATDSFNREVTLLSSLKHPHLPRFYAHFTDASHWYLVMEYIRGRTLEDHLKRSRRGYLSLSQAMNIGQALADVLAYLHAQRPAVIFRDVKPANIMLTHTGRIYLIDFGIARRFSPAKTKILARSVHLAMPRPNSMGEPRPISEPICTAWEPLCKRCSPGVTLWNCVLASHHCVQSHYPLLSRSCSLPC